MDRCKRITRPLPSWLNDVTLTSDIIYKYQLTAKAVGDVLQADLKFLKRIHQVIGTNNYNELYGITRKTVGSFN